MPVLTPVRDPVAGAGAELRPDDVLWITSENSPESLLSLSEEAIAVIDLRTFSEEGLPAFLQPLRNHDRRCSMIALADWEIVASVTAMLTDSNIALMVRPTDARDQEVRSYVAQQLAEVYKPFERSGVEFVATHEQESSGGGAMGKSKKSDLLRSIFGEELTGVEPKTSEIAPEYLQPPFAFSPEQQAALLRLANRPQTELRDEDEEK